MFTNEKKKIEIIHKPYQLLLEKRKQFFKKKHIFLIFTERSS